MLNQPAVSGSPVTVGNWEQLGFEVALERRDFVPVLLCQSVAAILHVSAYDNVGTGSQWVCPVIFSISSMLDGTIFSCKQINIIKTHLREAKGHARSADDVRIFTACQC